MTTKTQTEKEETAEEKIKEKIDEYISGHREEIVNIGILAMNPIGYAVVYLRGISGKVEDMTISIGFYKSGTTVNLANIEDSVEILSIDESSDLDLDDDDLCVVRDEDRNIYRSEKHCKYIPSDDEYSEKNRLTEDEYYDEKVDVLRETLIYEYLGSEEHDNYLNTSIEDYLRRYDD